MPTAQALSWWTEERIARLRALVQQGRTAGQIATEMGTTRNSIIGKAHRIGLPLTKQNDGRTPEQRRATRLQYQRDRHARLRREGGLTYKPAKPKPAPLPQPKPVGALELFDLGPRQCRWPITDDAPFFFCGNETNGRDYCPFHCQLSINPNQTRRRDRVWVF